jgi:TrmH family RNA methyltransferase
MPRAVGGWTLVRTPAWTEPETRRLATPALPVIASPSNPRIKAAVRLREPRERAASGLTLVDGAREVRRALDAGVEMVEVFICEPQLTGPDARAAFDALLAAGTPIQPVTKAAMAKLAFGDRHEGIVAVIRAPSQALDALVLPGAPLVVVVDGIEKPGNLGAILRSADGAGAEAVIAASPRTDLANPNVIRAMHGIADSLNVSVTAAILLYEARRQRDRQPGGPD